MSKSHSGSYDPQQTFQGFDAELSRLEAQVQLSWYEEALLLKRIGLQDGMSVLELGSGPGFFTERLLTLLPTSHITALEVRPDLFAIVQQRLAGRSTRLHLVQGSLYDMDFPANTFDIAIARFVFQHLEQTTLAASTISRVLKPGGRLIIIDVDAALWGIVEPYMPGLERIYAKAELLQAQQGGSRLIGRRLWRVLNTTGYLAPRLEAFVYHSDELSIDVFDPHLNPNRLLPAVLAGILSIEEYMEVQQGYQKLQASDNAYILMLGFMAHGTKPSILTSGFAG